MDLKDIETKLHDVWTTAYTNALTVYNIATAYTEKEFSSVEQRTAKALEHAEAAVKAYKDLFVSFVETEYNKVKKDL